MLRRVAVMFAVLSLALLSAPPAVAIDPPVIDKSALPPDETGPDTPTEQQDARDAILDQGYEAVLRVNLENIDTTVIETDEHDFHWTVVNIKTSLWDAGTDQLVWSAETRTKNPANERDLAKSISAVLLPALTKAQLILPVRPPHGT